MNDLGKLYEFQNPVSINNILFKVFYSHAYSFNIVYGCFDVTMAELKSCDRDQMVCKA